jgi:hypothetical protein
LIPTKNRLYLYIKNILVLNKAASKRRWTRTVRNTLYKPIYVWGGHSIGHRTTRKLTFHLVARIGHPARCPTPTAVCRHRILTYGFVSSPPQRPSLAGCGIRDCRGCSTANNPVERTAPCRKSEADGTSPLRVSLGEDLDGCQATGLRRSATGTRPRKRKSGLRREAAPRPRNAPGSEACKPEK